MTDDIFDALPLLDAFEKFEHVLFCWIDIFGIEDGSWYAYKESKDPSVRHNLTTSERIK